MKRYTELQQYEAVGLKWSADSYSLTLDMLDIIKTRQLLGVWPSSRFTNAMEQRALRRDLAFELLADRDDFFRQQFMRAPELYRSLYGTPLLTQLRKLEYSCRNGKLKVPPVRRAVSELLQLLGMWHLKL